MGSSDESFAWTNASNDNSDSIDSDDETLEPKGNMKYNKDNSHSEEEEVKHDLQIKAKKRKTSFVNDSGSPKKKRIKTEPESDVDIKNKKTKIKQDLSTDSSFNDSYLDLRVKEEQTSDSNIKSKKVKKSKKKRHSTETKDSEIDDNKIKTHDSEEESRHSFVIEDKITVEETVITEPQSYHVQETPGENSVKHKKKKKKHKRSVSEYNDVSNNLEDCENNSILLNETCTNKYNNINVPQGIIQNGNEDELMGNVDVEDTKKTRKISERIRFEDDTSDMDVSQQNDSTMIEDSQNSESKQIKHFVRENTKLQKMKTFVSKKHSIITEMDEVWLVKCPRDIDITQLTGLKLDVCSKSKIKIDGKNYDSIIHDNVARLPILSYSCENKPVIQNIKLNGCINLRKRLPKAHIPDSEISVDDQSNFIPLPETKCRHPLFGVNYKKLIKIPVNVAERLNNNNPVVESDDNIKETDCSVRKKKKKHKKEKSLNIEMEVQETVKDEKKKKKARKRKYSQEEESPPAKRKRVKNDPDCAETWESEKAIEETLFNF